MKVKRRVPFIFRGPAGDVTIVKRMSRAQSARQILGSEKVVGDREHLSFRAEMLLR